MQVPFSLPPDSNDLLQRNRPDRSSQLRDDRFAGELRREVQRNADARRRARIEEAAEQEAERRGSIEDRIERDKVDWTDRTPVGTEPTRDQAEPDPADAAPRLFTTTLGDEPAHHTQGEAGTMSSEPRDASAGLAPSAGQESPTSERSNSHPDGAQAAGFDPARSEATPSSPLGSDLDSTSQLQPAGTPGAPAASPSAPHVASADEVPAADQEGGASSQAPAEASGVIEVPTAGSDAGDQSTASTAPQSGAAAAGSSASTPGPQAETGSAAASPNPSASATQDYAAGIGGVGANGSDASGGSGHDPGAQNSSSQDPGTHTAGNSGRGVQTAQAGPESTVQTVDAVSAQSARAANADAAAGEAAIALADGPDLGSRDVAQPPESGPQPVATLEGREETTGSRVRAASNGSFDGSAPVPEDPDAVRILHQFRSHVAGDTREATLNLVPARLGRMAIRLRMKGGRLEAHMRVESAETLQTLERNLPELRASLAKEGIAADEFVLELGFDDSGDGHSSEREPFHSSNAPGRTAAVAVDAPRASVAPDSHAPPHPTNDTLSSIDTLA